MRILADRPNLLKKFLARGFQAPLAAATTEKKTSHEPVTTLEAWASSVYIQRPGGVSSILAKTPAGCWYFTRNGS